jgi:hypothetical protein
LGWKPTAGSPVAIVSGEHLFPGNAFREEPNNRQWAIRAETHPRSEALTASWWRTQRTGASTRRVETSGGHVREEKTRRMVGVSESLLRCADSLPDDRTGAEPSQPKLLLRKHDAARRQDAKAARPAEGESHSPRKWYVGSRTRLDASASGKFAAANATVGDGSDHGFHGSPARMIDALKQAGMIAVLVLLSEGLFVLYGALGHGDRTGTEPAPTAALVGGAILCSSALMLLYSLGTRDEKWIENALDQDRKHKSARTHVSRGIYFRRATRRNIATDQGVERMHVRPPKSGLGKPLERLGSTAQSVLEFVSVRGTRARTGFDEVRAVPPRAGRLPSDTQ